MCVNLLEKGELPYKDFIKQQKIIMKAHVDQDTCIGCGLCPQICSEVFELNDDGKAYAKVEKVPSDMENAATEAQESCPVAAITVD